MISKIAHRVARRGLFAVSFICCAGSASASVISISGSLDDPANLALVGSCPDASTCNDSSQTLSFDPYYVANNVALYAFHVATAGTVNFLSTGYAALGIDPYFTLFAGTGGTATFLDSNYNQAFFGSGGDFDISDILAVGDYTVALGAFGNMSLAENWGSGTLADGFTGLGNGPSVDHNYSYALTITTPDSNGGGGGGGTVPEPGSVALTLIALLAAARQSRSRPAQFSIGGR